MMRKISVIIPVYNVESHIENSLLSALNQTYKNVEYVIIDDCGTDNSIGVVERIKGQFSDKEIKIIHHTNNQGVSVARNTGIENCSGDYVYIMDSDDTISLDCLQRHIEAIESYGADISCSNTTVVNGRSPFDEIQHNLVIEGDDILIEYFSKNVFISSCNKMYKKSFLNENNIRYVENITMCEDALWCMDCCVSANRVVMIPDYTYNYIVHSGSAVTSSDNRRIEKHFDSIVYVMNSIIDVIKKKNSNDINNAAGVRLGTLRFKNSARLCLLDLDENTKKEIFSNMNADILVKYSRGVYSYLCNMPYPIFKAIIYIPYFIFDVIKKVKYNR